MYRGVSLRDYYYVDIQELNSIVESKRLQCTPDIVAMFIVAIRI